MQTKYINIHSTFFIMALYIFTLFLYNFDKNEYTELESLLLVLASMFGNWLSKMINIPLFLWQIDLILVMVFQFKLKSCDKEFMRSYKAKSLHAFFITTVKIILILYPLYLYFKVWFVLNFYCQFILA